MSSTRDTQIQTFVAELAGFAHQAEETLTEIEKDMDSNKGLFAVFSERMFAIRGTAQQLSLEHIAEFAGMGEEIAIKAVSAHSHSQIRKCVGSLWDTLTTIQYLLEHYQEETGEEQGILMNRLQLTLKALGGARPIVNESEIEQLLSQRK